MTPLVERLALSIPAPCVCVEKALCVQHLAAVDALRAALGAAAKVARDHECSGEEHHEQFCGDMIAAAIEALAE